MPTSLEGRERLSLDPKIAEQQLISEGWVKAPAPNWVEEEQETQEVEEPPTWAEHTGGKLWEGFAGMVSSVPEGLGIGWASLPGQDPGDVWLAQLGGWAREKSRYDRKSMAYGKTNTPTI